MIWGIMAALILLTALVPVGWWYLQDTRLYRGATARPVAYVGDSVCAECHAAQSREWRGSHHQQAMQPERPHQLEIALPDPGGHQAAAG